MTKYKNIGYYNDIDAVMLSDKTADEIVEYMKKGNGAFYSTEYDCFVEDKEYFLSNFCTKLTKDEKYLVVIDVADRFDNIPLDLVNGNAEDEFIDIYVLIDEI